MVVTHTTSTGDPHKIGSIYDISIVFTCFYDSWNDTTPLFIDLFLSTYFFPVLFCAICTFFASFFFFFFFVSASSDGKIFCYLARRGRVVYLVAEIEVSFDVDDFTRDPTRNGVSKVVEYGLLLGCPLLTSQRSILFSHILHDIRIFTMLLL